MRRGLFLTLLISCVVVITHLMAHAVALGTTESPLPYSVGVARKADRVVLVVVDSLPLRIAQDVRLMPRMSALRLRGASGVLWVSKQTSTMPGILGLAAGTSANLVDTLRIFSNAAYAGWTIFNDVHDRGETIAFEGDPKWVALFGHLARNGRELGGAPAPEDDMAALRRAGAELRSASPPAVLVVHVVETDNVAHQYGTRAPIYEAAIRGWDAALGDFVEGALDGHTAVIVTSDHGNDELGRHGGCDDVYRRVPVWMFGRGIRPVHGITMNSVDMPATIALLLGTRLPGGARVAPATAAIALDAREEARVLLATWDRLLALEPVPRVASDHREAIARLRGAGLQGRFGDVIGPARGAIASLVEAMETQRRASAAGIAWALSIASAAAAACVLAFARRAAPPVVALLVVAFLGCEALLISRFRFAAPIKALLRGHPAIAAIAVAAIVGASVLLARQRSVAEALRGACRQPLAIAFAAFALCSALRPLSSTAILFLCLLAAALRAARPSGAAWLSLPLFAGYFFASSAVVLPRLGEAAAPRYAWGLAAAAICFVWIDRGPCRSIDRLSRAALPALLVVAPFGRLEVPTGHPIAAQILAFAVLTVLAIARGAPRVVLAPFATSTVLVVAPSQLTFALALVFPLVLLLYPHGAEARSVRALRVTLVAFALCAMSKPDDVPTVAILFAVLVALAEQLSAPGGADLAVGLAAVAVAVGRCAFFELFGHADSPAASYGFVHLDLAPSFLGGDGFDLPRAIFLVLLKVFLASCVVLGAVQLAPRSPQLDDRIAAGSAALMMLEVLHDTVRMNLSVGSISERFDVQLFSIFVRSALYVSMVLGHAALRGAVRLRQA